MKKKCAEHGSLTCECGQVITRCKCRGPVPVDTILCIHSMTPPELFEEILLNAAAGHSEHPARMFFACMRIAQDRYGRKPSGSEVDTVFQDLQNQLKSRTGRSRFPETAIIANLN